MQSTTKSQLLSSLLELTKPQQIIPQQHTDNHITNYIQVPEGSSPHPFLHNSPVSQYRQYFFLSLRGGEGVGGAVTT